MTKLKILLIAAGGTIAQEHDANGATNEFLSSNFYEEINGIVDEINELLNKKSSIEIHGISNIDVDKSLEQIDSTRVNFEYWEQLIDKITENYHRYDAFVITIGTNTLGYTSAALSFALTNLSKPVVLTGAQVSFGYPGSDVRMNLENAIRIAAYKCDAFETLAGVLVVLGSAVITGTRAKKKTEFDYDAFKSFNANTIGRIGNSIRMNESGLIRHMHCWISNPCLPDVNKKGLVVEKKFDMNIASLTEYPGMKSELLISLANKSNDYSVNGFILRATGAGDPNVFDSNNLSLKNGFEFLRDNRIPIVVTTQAPDGIASMKVNNLGVIAERDFKAIPAWDMSMEAMTVKLAWLLGQNLPYEDIREMMVKPIKGEICPL